LSCSATLIAAARILSLLARSLVVVVIPLNQFDHLRWRHTRQVTFSHGGDDGCAIQLGQGRDQILCTTFDIHPSEPKHPLTWRQISPHGGKPQSSFPQVGLWVMVVLPAISQETLLQ
jgi:hypothetical protein